MSFSARHGAFPVAVSNSCTADAEYEAFHTSDLCRRSMFQLCAEQLQLSWCILQRLGKLSVQRVLLGLFCLSVP